MRSGCVHVHMRVLCACRVRVCSCSLVALLHVDTSPSHHVVVTTFVQNDGVDAKQAVPVGAYRFGGRFKYLDLGPGKQGSFKFTGAFVGSTHSQLLEFLFRFQINSRSRAGCSAPTPTATTWKLTPSSAT